jgi:DivIVA domain-containing protein
MTAHHDPSPNTPRLMTVDEIRAAAFQQSPLAWRGYSEEEVDTFVARVAHSLQEAQRETAALRAEVDRLRNFYKRHGTDVDHSVDRREAWFTPADINPLIVEAQKYVETQVAQADTYAELVSTEARDQADEMLAHAQLRARIVVEDMVRTFRSRVHDPGRATVHLEQLAVWSQALAESLWAQTSAMTSAVEAELAT